LNARINLPLKIESRLYFFWFAVAKGNNKPPKQAKHPGVPGQTIRVFQPRPPGCSEREDPGVFKLLLMDYSLNKGSYAIMRGSS
jgi:hypothetical protein